MSSYTDLMQMCRLCLVKEQVNLPIFDGQGELQQIFLKITACLPVKVSREDNLPKSICDGCSYKLDLLYQFWNTSSNSEKQLIDWLTEAGVDPKHTSNEPIGLASQSDVILKQEPVSELDISSDAQNYILQQQQLAYKPEDYDESQQNAKSTKSKPVGDAGDEPSPKRPRRATRNSKSVREDDSDDDYVDTTVADIAKTEEDSEEEDDEDDGEVDDMVDDVDDTADPDFVAVGEDTEQPGPSGVSGTKTTTGPCKDEAMAYASVDDDDDDDDDDDEEAEEILIETVAEHNFQCEVCALVFPDRAAFLEHHMSQFGSRFSCCRCGGSFKNTTELYQHYELHKLERAQYVVDDGEDDALATADYVTVVTHEPEEVGDVVHEPQAATIYAEEVLYDDEQVEAVINIPGERAAAGVQQELMYIVDDDNQCINEVVIETAENACRTAKDASRSIVEVDHGYIIPSCFRGQIEAKKRPATAVKKEVTMVQITDAADLKADPEPVHTQVVYTDDAPETPAPRVKLPLVPRKRHDVPDFSATNCEVVHPNCDVDILHYKCVRCEQLFINKFVFVRHIEKGKCYINSCDVCPATFTKNTEFYNHYVSAHAERAICNFCFRTFMYEKNVKEHMLRHLDQFRHRCEECNKGFYTVREYRNHYKNRHMGIRHKCAECGRSFADEYYFKKHIATHGLTIATEIVQI